MDDPDGLAGHLDPHRLPNELTGHTAGAGIDLDAGVRSADAHVRPRCDEFTVVFPVYLYVFSSYG
jgi:hypothetical protein